MYRITESKAPIQDLLRHTLQTLYYNFHDATNI